MSFRNVILATTAILAATSAHMTMDSPTPYAIDKLDNSPITAAQYPCKSQNGFSFQSATAMKVGDTQTVKLKGSAIHGGGGCQLSVAQGYNPTADTQFKVVATLEGCPKKENDEFTFTLPEGTPNGNLTFAWTWFSRLAGQPEMYMNCAPITVTGGSDDTSGFDALPNMLKANLGEGCTTVANMNVKFPDPGQQFIAEASQAEAVAPTGNCGSTGNGGEAPSSAAGGAPTSAAGGAPTSAPAASSAAASNPGGVFAPGASSGAGAPQSTLTTLVTVTAAPSSPAEATSAPAAGTGAPAAPTSPSTGGGATCSENGAIVCNGTTQFGLCDNGKVVWQDVAAGTTCSNGVIQKRTTYTRQLRGRVARPRVVPGKDFTSDE